MLSNIIVQRLRQRNSRKLIKLTLSLERRIKTFFCYLLILASCHIAAMMLLENLSLQQAFWLTVTTLTTVGYGDVSAQTLAGQLATTILIYAVGISILAQLASDFIEYRMEQRRKMLTGRWRWFMENHLVILNAPKNGCDPYFKRLIPQIRQHALFAEMPIQLLNENYSEGLPSELKSQGVVHFHGQAIQNAALESINVQHAKYIILLAADEHAAQSDSITFDILHRIRAINPRAHIVAECVEDINRQRLILAGATSLIRPVRAYPEIVIRTLLAPGSEKFLENLFDHDGLQTIRYDVQLQQVCWKTLIQTLIASDLGTPISYIDHQEQMQVPTTHEELIDGKAILLLINSKKEINTHALAQAIQAVNGAHL